MRELDINQQRLDANGYMYVYSPKHEMANKSGKVYVHRFVASKYYGVILTSNQNVHHKDGNRVNNSASNLEILDARDHVIHHMIERRVKISGLVYPIFSPIQATWDI